MKALNLVSIVLAVILPLAVTIAQPRPPDSLWSRTYGGCGYDECLSFQQTVDGGYILAGVTAFPNLYEDFFLVKTNANGDECWSRTFSFEEYNWCRSVQQTFDGGYILGGSSGGWCGVEQRLWLVKADTNGIEEWRTCLGSGPGQRSICVRQTTDGGYIVGTSTFGSDLADFWLVKVHTSGDTLWSRAYNQSDEDWVQAVQPTSDGGYVLAGWAFSYEVASSQFWMMKTSANGDSLWSRTFGGTRGEECYAVQQISDGGYILAGHTWSFGAGQSDIWVLKTNSNGDSLWSRTFGGSSFEYCHSVKQTSDGGFVLAGYTSSFGEGGDFWLVKMGENGDSLWSRTFGGQRHDCCYSVQQSLDGGYALAGGTQSFGASESDFWLVKIGPELAAEPISFSLPSQYALHPNWPNPFNPYTRISYDLPKRGYVTLTIFDLLGREVATIVHSMQAAGNHTTIFDGSRLPSGIYFCRIQADDFVDAKKMVLLK